MRIGKTVASTLVLLTIGVWPAACASTPPDRSAALAPLQLALTTPPDELRARAQAGDAQAQYALSILHSRGRGVELDRRQAIELRRKATAQRGSTPITTYIAGLNGAPGRVSTIYVPRYALSPGAAAVSDVCLSVLEMPTASPNSMEACGGPDRYAQLRALWGEGR